MKITIDTNQFEISELLIAIANQKNELDSHKKKLIEMNSRGTKYNALKAINNRIKDLTSIYVKLYNASI